MKRLVGVFVGLFIYFLSVTTVGAIGCGNVITAAGAATPTCECTNSSGGIQAVPISDTQFCCGWSDDSEPDNCVATEPITGPAQCGDEFRAPRACECTNSGSQPQIVNLGGGQYCCGWHNPETPADRCQATEFSYGCGATVILDAAQAPTFACSCPGTNWFPSQQTETTKTHCCGFFFEGATNKCSPTLVANPRCFNTSGCGLCTDAQAYCRVQSGLASCEKIPGQCGFPEPEPPADPPPADPPPGDAEPPPEGGGDVEESSGLNIFDPPTSETFRLLNPFNIIGGDTAADRFSSPTGFINRALAFLFPLAGLALFFMLVWGGFEILSKAADAKAVQAGRQRITAAVIGFTLLFTSFWIIQIVEWVFGLSIL